MGFGYNRYALVLGFLAATGALGAVGCGSSGRSSKAVGTTTAPTTSGTAPTTSNTQPGVNQGPALVSAAFMDVDGNNMIGAGDKLVCTFAAEVMPVGNAAVDAATEFALAVNGDSFGTGARVQNGPISTQLEIVLGQGASMRVSDTYTPGIHDPGSPSGINVSALGSGQLRGVNNGRVMPAIAPLDLVGQLSAGFIPAGSLNFARGGHTATLLDSGMILIAGGRAAGGDKDFVAQAELFDPVAGTAVTVSDLSGDAGFMKNGNVKVKMVAGASVRLNDGTVLICGGYGIEKKSLFGIGPEKVDTLKSAFIFDPTTLTFTKVGDMNYPRHSFTASLMDDGRVLIAGGFNDDWWKKQKTQAPFEIYDPAKRSFEKSGSIFARFKSKEPRMGHTATAIESGSGILLVGGSHYEGGGLFGLIKPKLKINSGSEVVRGTLTERAGDLGEPRINHAAVKVTPGQVLVAGGHNLSNAVASLELYDEASGQFSPAGSLAQARSGCEVAVVGGQALIMGGYDGATELASVEVFDVATRTVSATSYTMATPRNSFTVTTLKDGRVVVIGGMVGGAKHYLSLDGQAVGNVEIFARQ